jgi:hypothetical protein
MSIDLDDLARDAVAKAPTRVPELNALRERVAQRRRRRRILTGAAVGPLLALAAVGTWALIDGDDHASQVIAAGRPDPTSVTPAAPASDGQFDSTDAEEPSGSSEDTMAAVPDVVGLDVDEATEILDELGLRTEILETSEPDAAPGMVTAAEPAPGSQVESGVTVTLTVATSPSQSEADAARDQIVPALAALPADVRINQKEEDLGPTRVDTAEGGWIISQPWAGRPAPTVPCLGDPGGTYGLETVCIDEYAEILLLDSRSGDILRAYPFPGLGPLSLQATDDSIYCIRQGDGGLPDSMLCRIDLATLDATVRVFPSALDSGFSLKPDRWVPASWTIDDPTDLVLWEHLDISADGITISGSSGSATVDPDTLELLTIDDTRG